MVYMRPETAQGIYVNFLNVMGPARQKIPFGIAQIGKAFRNEITPGNFIFRTREFEQMEMQFFVKPGDDERWFEYWREQGWQWYQDIGIREDKLRWHAHGPDELAHYARAAYDIEYEFPWGWDELEGIANRTDFDLRQHAEHSGQTLTYAEEGEEPFFPFVIEPAGGATRTTFAFLIDAYDVDEVGGEERTVMRLDYRLAPIKVAVLPLSKKEDLVAVTEQVAAPLRELWNIEVDVTQSIGRRYRRQDEIGTPFCVTVDFETLEDNAVTVRDRDTTEQVRLPISELADHLTARLGL